MKKKAIVLGGTHDHIELLKNLKKRNFYTLLIDYNSNPPAKKYADKFFNESTLDKSVVLNIAKKESVKLVIATCVDQALLTMAYVSEKLNV